MKVGMDIVFLDIAESSKVCLYFFSVDVIEQDDIGPGSLSESQADEKDNEERKEKEERMSYASMASHRNRSSDQSSSQHKSDKFEEYQLVFSINGYPLHPSDTILKCLQLYSLQTDESDKNTYVMDDLWQDVHEVLFRVEKKPQKTEKKKRELNKVGWTELKLGPSVECLPVSDLQQLSITSGASIDTVDAILVLRALNGISRLPLHSRNESWVGDGSKGLRSLLVNPQITAKMSQQLKDFLLVCSNNLPPWCATLLSHAKFLFSFEVRRRVFLYTSFGIGRTLAALLQAQNSEDILDQPRSTNAPLRMPRISRQKVRISRSHILDSAKKVFQRYAVKDARLEVEFYHEAGSGLGPTLEFYTLLSHEFQKKSLRMWIEDSTTSHMINHPGHAFDPFAKAETLKSKKEEQYVFARYGLYPRPIRPQNSRNSTKLLELFTLLGKVLGKCLQDNRLLDLNISPAFYRLVMNKNLGIRDLRLISPEIASLLEKLVNAKARSEEHGEPVTVDGASVDDLCLYFVLPGDESFELCPNGANKQLNSSNIMEYVDLIVDALVGSGVASQISAFQDGFNSIFDIKSLNIFYEDEIGLLICGTGGEKKWEQDALTRSIKLDHGYTSSSAPVLALIRVMSELDADDQRRFLRFVTGAAALPPGGFPALNPPLTVVRKSPPSPSDMGMNKDEMDVDGEQLNQLLADRDLPSVMTCANYLKLPPYSNEQILKEKLLYAIREGQGSFDLS